MSDGEESDLTDDSAAQRRGRAIVALAEAARPGWLRACVDAAVEDPHPFVRGEAWRSAEAAPEPGEVPRLLAAWLDAPEAAHRFRALRLLQRCEPRGAVAALAVEARQGAERGRRLRAAEALGKLGRRAVGALVALSESDDAGLRARAAKGLGMSGAEQALAALERLLDDPVATVRTASLRALGRLADRPGLGASLGTLEPALLRLGSQECDREVREQLLLTAARAGARLEPDEEVSAAARGGDRALAAAALAVLARAGAGGELADLAASGNPWLARAAAWAAATTAGPADLAMELLDSPDGVVRAAAVRALGRVTPASAGTVRALERAAADEDEGVRWLAERALAGRLDDAAAARHLAREPARGPSASWPFGLPPPEGGAAGRGQRRALPLAVAAWNPSYNLNLGVLLRSAEAAGASHFFVVGSDFHHRAAAMGADRWVDVRVVETHEAMAAEARALGYQLVAVQQSPGAERFDRASYPPRPCLLLGSEGHGLPPRACAEADLVVEVPIVGLIDSLNVACAGTLVLWACLASRGWLCDGADAL